MKTNTQDLQYHNELLWKDLLKCYIELSTNKSVETHLLINNHKRLLSHMSIFGKNKDKTLNLLISFINRYKINKPHALQLFMCTLNNRGMLSQIYN